MGCCLCTSNQIVVTSIQREDIISCVRAQVSLRPLISHKCDCLYSCGGDQFIYYLKLSFPVSIQIFDLLFERGFVRNSDYFRKYDLNSCCIGYNIRINIKNHLLTSRQQKIIKKFITKYMPQITNNQLKKKNSISPLEDSKNKNKSSKVQNKNTINNSHFVKNNSQLIECIQEIQLLLENNKKQITQLLELEQFNSKIENLQILKIFESQTPYIYYSNFNLLLFEQNKRFSKDSKLSLENINQMLNIILKSQIFQENYKIIYGNSGYFTFFDLRNVNPDLVQNIEKQKTKQNNRKTKLNNSQHPLKQNEIKLTDKSVQTIVVNELNEFKIGDLNIQIIEPMFNQELFSLYQNYMNEVHKNQVDEEFFKCYYATVISEKNQVIFSTNSQQSLNLGQKHMYYRIKGKLIACGVILLLSNILISEYLFYDPILKPYGFGIFSTFIEIEYVKIIQKHFPDFIYHSLSYVIVKNKSMNYKLQFLGLEIQCPQTYRWLKYTDELKELIKNNSTQLDFQLEDQNKQFDLGQCLILINGQIVQVKTINSENRLEIIKILENYLKILGENLMNQLVFVQINQ